MSDHKLGGLLSWEREWAKETKRLPHGIARELAGYTIRGASPVFHDLVDALSALELYDREGLAAFRDKFGMPGCTRERFELDAYGHGRWVQTDCQICTRRRTVLQS